MKDDFRKLTPPRAQVKIYGFLPKPWQQRHENSNLTHVTWIFTLNSQNFRMAKIQAITDYSIELFALQIV